MATLLRNLLFDLGQRASHLEAELTGIRGLPQVAESYRRRMTALLRQAGGAIAGLAGDPDLLSAAVVRDNFRIYKRLSECVSALEWGPVTALKRFRSPDDTLMTLMTERLCREIGYPFPPPLCVAGGYTHYFTYADMDLIVAPSAEPFHLLGLSDVYHELGHIIAQRRPAELEGPFHAAIDTHFAAEVKQARQDGKADAFVRKLRQLRRRWKAWLIEFTADMIAAFLTGPAYGWANVRLCMNVAGDVFEPNASHPADDARATAIGLVLYGLGLAAEADAIRRTWSEFLALAGPSRPQEFDIEFPPQLLERLRDFVVRGCGSVGLTGYHLQPASSPCINVTRLLTEAWARFNADPATFATWEAGQVAASRAEMGI